MGFLMIDEKDSWKNKIPDCGLERSGEPLRASMPDGRHFVALRIAKSFIW
jgi:hypothetical protein